MKKSKVLDFDSAFKYPFSKAKRMWNILWLLFPIFGWFALGGYGVRIVQEFSKGKFKQLPEMKFGKDMTLGVMMFLKAIPFVVVYFVVLSILDYIPVLGDVGMVLIELFVIPMLTINFFNKMTVESYFEFRKLNAVFDNMGDYLMAVLKSIGLAVIWIVLMIVLVGIPALMFTQNIFLADFYRRCVK